MVSSLYLSTDQMVENIEGRKYVCPRCEAVYQTNGSLEIRFYIYTYRPRYRIKMEGVRLRGGSETVYGLALRDPLASPDVHIDRFWDYTM